MKTISPPSGCIETDVFWKTFFENRSENDQVPCEISFVAETVAPKSTLLQKIFGPSPQPQLLTVTMKEFEPSKTAIHNEAISLYSTQEEVDGIREMQLSGNYVCCSYVFGILPKRHRVSFPIGNLTELKFTT